MNEHLFCGDVLRPCFEDVYSSINDEPENDYLSEYYDYADNQEPYDWIDNSEPYDWPDSSQAYERTSDSEHYEEAN